MDDIVIRAESLGKRYRLGRSRQRYKSVRESFVGSLSSSIRRVRRGPVEPGSARRAPDFWAVRDVSFDVKRGEVLGIVGRNGAGKSTILKILSRITEPTEGEVRIRGRVASLLEVGTGFNPELSGRDNVYLNGAILGMTRLEIARKFDEIVAFAQVEKFIDTQVKKYSSGMYLRLAFAVAAHLEPEVLIVDEVLAVGDAEFRRKCLGKMEDVAKTGRTVIFVSHNLAAVNSLCSSCLWLDSGAVRHRGTPSETVERYLSEGAGGKAGSSLRTAPRAGGEGPFRFVGYSLHDATGSEVGLPVSGQPLEIRLAFESDRVLERGRVEVNLGLHGLLDENLFLLSTSSASQSGACPERGEFRCFIDKLPLQPGRYSFNLSAYVGGGLSDWIRSAGSIDVETGDFFGNGWLPALHQGPMLVDQAWGIGAPRDAVGTGQR